MKILIAGTYGAFCELLIKRLKREKHDVYIISGRENDNTPKGCVNYNLELTNEKLKFVVHSIMPDAIIFMGSLDENYDFQAEQKASMNFMAGLSNMLLVASSLNINRFIYLSTCAVYGARRDASFIEDMKRQPEDISSIIFTEGESLCMKFNEVSTIKVIVLRFSDIYGISSDKAFDFCDILISDVTSNEDQFNVSNLNEESTRENSLKGIYISPIYVSDAVDAVYKASTIDISQGGTYNVSSSRVSILYIYNKIKELTGKENSNSKNTEHTGNEANIEEINKKQMNKDIETNQGITSNLSVDYSIFANKYGYKPLVDINEGLTRMYRAKQKSNKNKSKKTINKNDVKEKRNIFQVIAPTIENILLFVLMVSVSILFGSNKVFQNIDFMIIYIVIISLTFGLFQASLSIILSGCFVIWRMMDGGMNVFDIFINLDAIVKIFEFLLIGIVCGHSRDRMHTLVSEKELALSDNQIELETIYNINDQNIKIKQALDERLVNYEDSLAKIYSIVDKLNSLQPDSVFFSAVNVIMEIMNSDDVSIYSVTGGNFKMCRLMAKTPFSIRNQKKSIPLSDLGLLAETLEQNKIYINHDLDDNLPIMAAPIFSNGSLVSIIMLWSVEFENLTLYNQNRFFVLSQLISSIIERAYIYTESINESMYLPDTSILMADAFENIIKVYKEASDNNISVYKTLQINCEDAETGLAISLEEISAKLRPLLRVTDYLGQCRDDVKKIYLLLTNTNNDDAKFVYDRLTDAGLTFKEAAL